MTQNQFTRIGLDRTVRLGWLEKTSTLVLAGNSHSMIKSILQEDLKLYFRSNNTSVRGSIDKTITILLRIWADTSGELKLLRNEGLSFLVHLPPADHLAIHWGMVTAVYPFWSNVAIQTGRLLKLQRTAVATQIQRRIREQYGERETVSRRTRYVLRSYIDWGVLQETGAKGVYTAGSTLSLEDSRLIAWLVEASLHARADSSASIKELIDSPSLFPFRIKPINAESLVAASSKLDLFRHGLNDDLIMLQKRKILPER